MPDRPVPVVRIREATDADGPRLIALINTAFSVETFLEGTRTDEERLNATMRNGTILVAEDDAGQLLACVFYQVRGSRGYLGQLAVDPAFQGRGLARLIFTAAEDRLRAAGCSTADIVVPTCGRNCCPSTAAGAIWSPESTRISARLVNLPPVLPAMVSRCRVNSRTCASARVRKFGRPRVSVF